MTKIKNSASKDWVVETIVKDTIKIFFVSIDGNNALMHGGNKQFISLLYKLNPYSKII